MAKETKKDTKKEDDKQAAQPGTSLAVSQGNVVTDPSSIPNYESLIPAGAKVKRHVTLPTIVIKRAGEGRCLFLMDAMRVSKIKDKDAKKEPATICTAGDVKTGEMGIFLVPAVVKENLIRDYPKDSYVGKSFVIQNKGKRTEAQRYNDFAIVEVDVPSSFEVIK